MKFLDTCMYIQSCLYLSQFLRWKRTLRLFLLNTWHQQSSSPEKKQLACLTNFVRITLSPCFHYRSVYNMRWTIAKTILQLCHGRGLKVRYSRINPPYRAYTFDSLSILFIDSTQFFQGKHYDGHCVDIYVNDENACEAAQTVFVVAFVFQRLRALRWFVLIVCLNEHESDYQIYRIAIFSHSNTWGSWWAGSLWSSLFLLVLTTTRVPGSRVTLWSVISRRAY